MANLVHLVFLMRFSSISSAQVSLEHLFPEHRDQDLTMMSFTLTPDFLTLQAVLLLQYPSYAAAFITAAVFWQVNTNTINYNTKVFSILFISSSCAYNLNNFFTPHYQLLGMFPPCLCTTKLQPQFCLGRFLRLPAFNST